MDDADPKREELADQLAEKKREIARLKGRLAESERRVRESEEARELLETVAQGITESILLIDMDLKILWANKALLEQTGRTPETIRGDYCYRVTHGRETPCEAPTDTCPIDELLRTGKPVTVPHTHVDGKGRPVLVEVSTYPLPDESGKPKLFVHVSRDVTERRRLEKEVLQTQKMESVGRLAGGVAHDFNNLLMAILGYTELALTDLPGNHPVRGPLEQVRKSGERAADLTRQLQIFSRSHPASPKVVDVNGLVEDLGKPLRRLIGPGIDLQIRTGSGVGFIKVDPGRFEQVLVNLAINAADAMPDGGSLVIETRDVLLEEEEALALDGLSSGRYVLIAVRDTGAGMDESVAARIFEPFFTTKEPGRGTGLGLSTCRDIVRQFGGRIRVESRPGKGATFRVYLPCVAGEPGRPDEREEEGESLRGTETVLLADDETAVGDLAALTLRRSGYRVLKATRGREALRLAEEHGPEPIHLLLTDVMMPGMSGPELARKLSETRPGLAVLFMTGYGPTGAEALSEAEREGRLLLKPFGRTALLRAVRRLLSK